MAIFLRADALVFDFDLSGCFLRDYDFWEVEPSKELDLAAASQSFFFSSSLLDTAQVTGHYFGCWGWPVLPHILHSWFFHLGCSWLETKADCLSLDLAVLPLVAKEHSLVMGPDGLSFPRWIGQCWESCWKEH